MVRILCIGDSHIPNRAKDLPEQIYEKLNELSREQLFDYTFFTGDIINFPHLLEYLNKKTKMNSFVVMGNMDYYYGNKDAPIYQNIEITFKDKDQIIVGLTHGAQINPRGDHTQLENLAIEKNYHIIVSGHTHKEEIYLSNKSRLLLNPGSVTGAWSFVASGNPSFIELIINKSTKEIAVSLIQLNKNSRELVISKFNFLFQNDSINKIL